MTKKIILILLIIIGFLTLGFSFGKKFFSKESFQNSPVLAQSSTDWPQLQHDAQHSGYVPQTVGPPYTQLWRVKHFPISTRVQPIIAENKIFLPSNNGSFYALNTVNGQISWSYLTGGALVNTAAYNQGKVYFGSTDHYIYALNAVNGSLAWRYLTSSTVKTAPVVAEGKVFIGGSDGYFYALEENSGSLVWRYYVGMPIYDSAAYDNGRVYFGGMDSKAYALEASTGNLLWSFQTNGQGFRDRWTVAGNGKAFFTPMLIDYHQALNSGTYLFHAENNIYNQPWSVQKQAIVDHLASNPYQQAMYVLNQQTGQQPFVAPVLYASGGSSSPHPQPVLLPNGNVNVIYRRGFPDEPAESGATTVDSLFVGELDVNSGDIIPIDDCRTINNGGRSCGSPFTSDESAALIKSGRILYEDIARGLIGLDTANNSFLPLIALLSPCVPPFLCNNDCSNIAVTFNDYVPPPVGWRLHDEPGEVIYQEANSDGNDTKRPTPLAGNVFYILHLSDLVAVQGAYQ